MSATGLLEIKRRINSVKNTQKITKAMGLISISKLRNAKTKLKENYCYFNQICNIKKEIFYIGRNENNIFLKKNKSNNKLFLVIASNSGLCGSFNGNCIEFINEKYGLEKENISVLMIGKRGISYINKYKLNLYKSYGDLDNEENYKNIKNIVFDFMESYYKENFGEVILVYTKYKSAIKQEVVEENLLPLKNEFKENENLHLDEVVSIEENLEELINILIYKYLEGKIINCIFDSKTSEQSVRMQAMNSATKNADDILKSLTSKYNRIRQSAITQEISEIVSGSEAQK